MKVSKERIQITFIDGKIQFDVHQRYSLKKVLAVASAVLGTVWTVIQFILPHIR